MDSIAKRPRTRLSPLKRKQQLMEIALEVFARRGIGRGGHADIAEIAQVSVATVFNYFPTREDLVDEVLNHVVRQFSNFLSDNIDLDIHARENIANITNAMIELVSQDCHWLKVWFEWSAQLVMKFGLYLCLPTALTNYWFKTCSLKRLNAVKCVINTIQNTWQIYSTVFVTRCSYKQTAPKVKPS